MSDGRYPISRDAMPIVQMQLRGMGEVVNHAVALHAEDIAKVAQDAVKEAIETFDWRARIASEVEAAVVRQVKSGIDRFLWSDEGTAMLNATIARAIAAAFGEPR